jgi:hypothetical protein
METVAFRFCEVCRFVSPSLYLFFLHTNLCFLPVLIAPMYYDFIKVCYVCCLFHVCVFFFYLLLLLPLLSLCLHSLLCLSTLLFFCSVVIGVFFPKCFFFLPSLVYGSRGCEYLLFGAMKFTDSFHPYCFLWCLYLRWFYARCWYLYFVFFRMTQFLFIFASNRMRGLFCRMELLAL